MRALPNLAIDVKRWHVASESVVLEVIIRGTHLGAWRGLPATGRRLEEGGVVDEEPVDELAAQAVEDIHVGGAAARDTRSASGQP